MENPPQPGNNRFETAKNIGAFMFFTLCAAALGAAGLDLAEKDAAHTEVALAVTDIAALTFTIGALIEWRRMWQD